ncbi:hypothetical protein HBB16_06455 [Pseudonocardia sp. MCCB 268]|nr:hypothetical protein [Pseudonocardia cytotoxica]
MRSAGTGGTTHSASARTPSCSSRRRDSGPAHDRRLRGRSPSARAARSAAPGYPLEELLVRIVGGLTAEDRARRAAADGVAPRTGRATASVAEPAPDPRPEDGAPRATAGCPRQGRRRSLRRLAADRRALGVRGLVRDRRWHAMSVSEPTPRERLAYRVRDQDPAPGCSRSARETTAPIETRVPPSGARRPDGRPAGRPCWPATSPRPRSTTLSTRELPAGRGRGRRDPHRGRPACSRGERAFEGSSAAPTVCPGLAALDLHWPAAIPCRTPARTSRT